jgi:hypothetical protein
MRLWVRQGYFSGARVALVRQCAAGPDAEPGDFVRSDRVDLNDLLA